MSDLKTIRGMPDLYGKDIEAISMIEKTCKEVFLAFNYSEIRTPLIEYKNEGYDMFLEMMTNMRRNVIYSMFMFQPKTDANEKN